LILARRRDDRGDEDTRRTHRPRCGGGNQDEVIAIGVVGRVADRPNVDLAETGVPEDLDDDAIVADCTQLDAGLPSTQPHRDALDAIHATAALKEAAREPNDRERGQRRRAADGAQPDPEAQCWATEGCPELIHDPSLVDWYLQRVVQRGKRVGRRDPVLARGVDARDRGRARRERHGGTG